MDQIIKKGLLAILYLGITIGLVFLSLVLYTVLPFQTDKFNIRETYQIIRSLGRSLYTSNHYHVQPSSDLTNQIDGMPIVQIPGGKTLMGSSEDPHSPNFPEHSVILNTFYIDQFEVTNSQYSKCVEQGGCSNPVPANPYFGNPIFNDYPMVYVSWPQAKNFCKWAKGDLPTEAEWEKAARGNIDGPYPWGKDSPSKSKANYGNNVGMLVSSYTYPDGQSVYGVFNMAGNAREWVRDRYVANYYKNSPKNNPVGPKLGDTKSLRGGSYLDDIHQITFYNRFDHEPSSAGINRGFRCVYRTWP